MAKYKGTGYSFFMSKIMQDGTLSPEIDIEEQFSGLVYKTCTGLESYGTPRKYEETYAESDMAYVYLGNGSSREQTDISLKLYFFCSDKTKKTDAEKIKSIDDVYHVFVNYVSDGLIIYRDTARQRKVVMYLNEATTPTTDRLYGLPYKEVEFKFKNLFGRSFDVDKEIILK